MAADSLADTLLRHATYLDRAASGIINQSVNPALIATAERVRAILADYDPAMSRIQFNALRAQIRAINSADLKAMFAAVSVGLNQIEANEVGYLVRTLGDFTDGGVKVKTPMIGAAAQTEMILGSGATKQVGTWAEYVAGNVSSATGLIDNTIRAGYADSLTKRELIKQVIGTKAINYQDGLYINRVLRQSDTFVRTGVSHYSSVAKDSVMADNADLIEGMVFLNVFDNRTTLTCLHYGQLAANGKVYKPNDPDMPRPPLHYNCRSQLIYKVIGLDPFSGSRSSVGGQNTAQASELFDAKQQRLNERRDRAAEQRLDGVPAKEVPSKVTRRGRADDEIFKPGVIDADTSPAEFMRQQPRWFVDSTLGKTRAKLFLDGNLPIERFTDIQGAPLTLAELRALDNTDAAFRRAGL